MPFTAITTPQTDSLWSVPTPTNAPRRAAATANHPRAGGKPNARGGAAGRLPGKCYGVFPDDRTVVFAVPREDVASMPVGFDASTGPFNLCRAFVAGGVCTLGGQCGLAHAILGRAARHLAHTRDAADTFACFATRATHSLVPVVTLGGGSVSAARTELVDIRRCLRTLAPLEKWVDTNARSGDPSPATVRSSSNTGTAQTLLLATSTSTAAATAAGGTHCTHWCESGYCHFGEHCRFVHALDLTSTPASSQQDGGAGGAHHHHPRSASDWDGGASLRSTSAPPRSGGDRRADDAAGAATLQHFDRRLATSPAGVARDPESASGHHLQPPSPPAARQYPFRHSPYGARPLERSTEEAPVA